MHAQLAALVVGRAAPQDRQSESPRARLERQLAEFADVRSANGDGQTGWSVVAQFLADASGPVGIVDARYVGHTSPLADTIADSRLGTAQLCVDEQRVGVLRIGHADLAMTEELARGLAAEAAPLRATELATRLFAAGVPVTRVDAAPYVAAVTKESDEARLVLDEVRRTDEHRLRLRAAARPGDGFYSTFVVRKIARQVTAGALRLGVRPDVITVLSLFVGIAAAGFFALGQSWAMVAGAVLLQLSLVLDCVDGEVARYTLRFSAFGAWLDAVADRVKEFAVYAGLAIGAAAAGADVWLLAGAALALLVVRHHVDFGFAIRQSARTDAGSPDAAGVSPHLAMAGRAARQLSERTNRRAAQMWAKRVVIMPIGERWLIISVFAAIWGARPVFVALLITGAVAALYTTIGRVLRSAADSVPLNARHRRDIAALTDAPGVIGEAAWLGRRYAWLAPAASRLVEFGTVLVVATALPDRGSLMAAYVVLAVVAMRLYDLVYRLRNLQVPPDKRAARAALGALGRPAVLAATALAGGVAFGIAALLVAALVAVVSAIDSSRAWRQDAFVPTPVPQLRGVA